MARVDDLRLMAKVARLYYEYGQRQSAIAKNLHLSQATVSRLLKRAEREGIVRITVRVPIGVYADLEVALAERYHLQDAVVVDCAESDDEAIIKRNIGGAAAHYVESTLANDAVIGISSWSSTLLEMVKAMHPLPRVSGIEVVQILGGTGAPGAETHAAYLISTLATLTGGIAYFLTAPGIVRSEDARQILMCDYSVQETFKRFDAVDLALVGIGTVAPSPLLASSGNVFSSEELAELRAKGAVGDVLQQFFDARGQWVETPLHQRVMGMRMAQLRRVARVVALAGGQRKFAAIHAALRGDWLDVLVTDRLTAERLMGE